MHGAMKIDKTSRCKGCNYKGKSWKIASVWLDLQLQGLFNQLVVVVVVGLLKPVQRTFAAQKLGKRA